MTLGIKYLLQFALAVPSKAPSNFHLTVKTSTSIAADWDLPPADSINGIIKGFTLFYKKKSPAGSSTNEITVGKSVRTEDVTGLEKYTEYEFQVLAFTSAGDGPKSSVEVDRTKEDGKKSEIIIQQL